MQALLTPFGRNAAYVSAVILLVILILIVLAFRQGREIRFWPPKIGLRPEHGKATRATGRNAQWPPSPLGGRPAGVAKVFEVTDAAQFYQSIAPNYDQRNSVNLLATHLEVIARLDKLRMAKPTLRVLDLGGGTGQNVATHFFSDTQLRWTYVDSCPAMLSQLRQHLAGRPLYERLSVYLADISQIHTQLPARSYDVVLLNLVLSSMPSLPDFARIGRLIITFACPARPGGGQPAG